MAPFFGLRGNSLNIAALLGVVMPAIMTFGYNQSLLGGILTLPTFEKQFPAIDAHGNSHKSTIQGTVTALYAVGGLFGAVLCIWQGDTLGRRRVIMIAAVIQIIGAILMSSAFDLAQLIVSRILVGAGTGGLLATVPVWQSEISPASKRGAHVVTTGVFIGMGLSLALFMDLGFSFAHGSISWRFPCAFQIILSLMALVFVSFMPDSPRWLVRQNRVSEALEILAVLDDVDTTSPEIEAEIRDAQHSLELSGSASVREIFSIGPQKILYRTILACSVLMFLQLTGVNAITFYTTTIFQKNLLLDSVTSRILAAIYQVVSPIGGIIAIFTIERFGRRGLMLISAAGNAICLILVAGLGSQSHNKHAIDGAVFFTFFFHFTYVLGFGGIPFLYATEIAPLRLRAVISGLGVATFWAFNFLMAEVTPVAFDAMAWRYFIIFAALNALMIPIIYYFFPETSGRSLEEIDEIFALSETILDPVRVAKRLPRRQLGNSEMHERDIEKIRRDFKVHDCEREATFAQVERVPA
ncbi:uncharacterized protein BHQ10_006484 [Talaromyces amestolkiae]|uniref:Major facilitator superfamily (MFS) profile domain-containing protein n=1 Tax=Talaromyces amestolkiae TaxID=1196081 RepID=A0A364L3T7_TALAM|nr:uncharacterized protein BHQ10_006484 [Talaromyces amestolkiae]RAO70472.1 hypothetical protein BHQ10_006484 [Talaromyces amestolkiae]